MADRHDGSDPTGEASSHRGAFGEFGGTSDAFIDRSFREKIIIVGASFPPYDDDVIEEHLDELERLVDTAGADVVARVLQRRDRPDPATYVGSGKVDEIRRLAVSHDCDTVVFDDELTPAQQRNLERILGRTAIDRTAVILDIFAQNASSLEGRTQVELAQLRYRLPRLAGRGKVLSQQGAGIGTRGPGETQLEVDRRRLVRRIQRLDRDLEAISAHRETQRKARRRSATPQVAIVGYTNAGKSTLLNRLTDAGVLVEDRLFATLDSTTRRLLLPGGDAVLLTDTVGFIRKLPHQLVEAFASTLEVTAEADLLVHVVDGSAADPDVEIDSVREVLESIGAAEVPQLLAVNKCDRGAEAAEFAARLPGSVMISAVTGEGVDTLLATIADRLRSMLTAVDLAVPWDRGDVIAAVHRSGEVILEEPGESGMAMNVRLAERDLVRFADFIVSEDGLPARASAASGRD